MSIKAHSAPATGSRTTFWIHRRGAFWRTRLGTDRRELEMTETSVHSPLLRDGFSIPERNNYRLAALHLGLNLFQLFLLPIYLLPKSLWWSVSIILIAAMNNPFWALIHEAIHDLLSTKANLNATLGRVRAICFGSPFQILRLTHLSHHKFNRSPLEKGTEIYNPNETSRFTAAVKYYFYILCGLYLLEVFSTFVFFIPLAAFRNMRHRVVENGNAQERWLARKFIDESRVREIRLDGAAIFLLFGLSAYCFRGHGLVYIGLLGMRTFMISFMDNVYHYRTPLRATVSGYNLFLPRVLSSLILHFNFHRIHHAHPSVPWKSLPMVFARQEERFDRRLWAAAWQQFSGPVPMSDPVAAGVNEPKYP
jgi:fatty acid desaturase